MSNSRSKIKSPKPEVNPLLGGVPTGRGGSLASPAKNTFLSLRNLSLEFRTRTGTVSALENISFYINPGETVGIVGESGSGKSVLALAIMGILDPAAHINSGEILWHSPLWNTSVEQQQSDTYDLL